MYIDKLDDMLNRYNNKYHSAIKMKPVDVNPDMCVEYNKENNKEGSKFKVGDHARIFLQKTLFQIGLKKFLWLKELKTLCLGDMLLVILMDKKLF